MELKGRWEVVLPGDEPPAARDLLTEATLPVEERGLQQRYTELSRFNVLMPPAGRYTLPGPEVLRLSRSIEGLHIVLLCIEASDDKEGDSNLLLPENDARLTPDQAIDFSWLQIGEAAIYCIEVEDARGNPVLSALLQAGVGAYRAPGWLKDKAPDGRLRWRVIAIEIAGDELAKSDWQTLQIGEPE